MTLKQVIRHALKQNGLLLDDESIQRDLIRFRDYVRESMVMTLNRHDDVMNRPITIKNRRYTFTQKENRPYGKMTVMQDGKTCPNAYSRCEVDTFIIDAQDGPAYATFKPTPIWPEALEDEIDMLEDYHAEIIKYTAMYIRMHEHNRAQTRSDSAKRW